MKHEVWENAIFLLLVLFIIVVFEWHASLIFGLNEVAVEFCV